MAGDKLAVAALRHRSWHLCHAALLPPEVVAFRGPAFFERRSHDLLPQMRIAKRDGVLVGFAAWQATKWTSCSWRKPSIAAARRQPLLQWAEAALVQQGVERAVLSCAIGNRRAERLYAKHGW